MTKAAVHQKHTTARQKLGSIVKQTARAVMHLVSALALVAAVSSCAATWEPFDCNAQPELCL